MAYLSSAIAQSLDRDLSGILENPFCGIKKIDYGTCLGVKRRQEVLVNRDDLVVLSDFAHHPTAITGALESLRARWPESKIIACFEPRSNTAVTNVFQERFAKALALADQTLIGQVHRVERIPEKDRINPQEMIEFIKAKDKLAHAFLTNNELGNFLYQTVNNSKEVSILVVFFSNGSFDGIIENLVNQFIDEIS